VLGSCSAIMTAAAVTLCQRSLSCQRRVRTT